jgi:hypothetical protein
MNKKGVCLETQVLRLLISMDLFIIKDDFSFQRSSGCEKIFLNQNVIEKLLNISNNRHIQSMPSLVMQQTIYNIVLVVSTMCQLLG